MSSTKLTRRTFAAGLGVPLILGAQNKSGSARPVAGTGDHTYEVIHDWGEVPANIRYGNTHGVCEDSQGRIYIHHTVNAASESADSMVVFDEKGKFVKSWGKEFKGGAHGLHIRKEGSTEFLYLCDTARGVVVKATLNGETVWSNGYPEQSEAYKPGADGKKPKWSPTNLAIAPNGDLYVADGYGSYYINHYNSRGEYLNTFGGRGSDPGLLKEPHGIWVDTRSGSPILTVADRRNNRLQRFTLDGRHIDFVTGFRLPCHFHERHGLVVIPDLQGRVTLIDRDNRVVAHLGDATPDSPKNPPRDTTDRASFVPGQFVTPHGAGFDHEGNIFVVEWVEIGRVTKLRKVA